MFGIEARNVNDAYVRGLGLLRRKGVEQNSRAGRVLVMPRPVITSYDHPTERVLFDAKRDANPFFHLFESLHMLAGRNDAVWLDRFISDFSARFSEDGVQHGAYGHRWRYALGFDQLAVVVSKLKANPDDRQCVIQMWDASDRDTLHESCGSDDLTGVWKDRPCNTHIYLRVRTEEEEGEPEPYGGKPLVRSVLDITVCCRSNDAVWGAYGANVVHFSILQEYLAAMIGVSVGKYYQFSNNFHVYTDVLNKVGEPAFNAQDTYGYGTNNPAQPMVTDPATFDEELLRFMEWTEEPEQQPFEYPGNPWFSHTAEPLFMATNRWRAKHRAQAVSIVNDPVFNIAPDWRRAALEWMQRRIK